MPRDVDTGETTPRATSRRGTLVAGRYRIDSLIAAGGMGEVWRATDEVLGRVVSVKFLHPQLAADENFLERMLREARAASAVNHPGVVAVYDFGRIDPEDGLPTSYIVMEHVDGPSLSQILNDGPLSVERTLTILEQTAAALHAAHESGVVHRDVKPGNIIQAPLGHVKLTDFGIARSQDTSTITDSGSITGTATYLSPEQASGETATASSDLYSLGVVIYSCLAGVVPFERDGPVAIALAHLKDEPPPLPDHIPEGVADLVMSLLQKRPDDRPPDAEAVRAQAALLLGGGATAKVPSWVSGPELGDTAVASAAVDQVEAEVEATQVAPVPEGLVQEEEEGAPEKRSRRKLFLILGLVAAALAAVAAFLIFGRGGGEPVKMPDVVGMQQPEAEAELKDLGLKAEIEVEDVPEKEAGTVTAQDEEEGTQVDKGSTVVLTVASGSVTLPVEELIGSTYQEAKAILADLGLKANRVRRESAVDPGTVLDIGENSSRVEVGSTVDLIVAARPKANPTPTPTATETPTDPDGTAVDGQSPDGQDTTGQGVDGQNTDGQNTDGETTEPETDPEGTETDPNGTEVDAVDPP